MARTARKDASADRAGRGDARGGNGGKGGKGGKGGRRGRRGGGSWAGRLVYWGVVLSLWCVIGVGALVAFHASKLPPIDQLAVPKRPPNIAILASDGSLLANRGETGGRTVTLKELPKYLPAAFVAIEDHRFYQHFGIDPLGIGRALVRNVMRSGGSVQGGSTLTQQLAKNLFLTQERTASRKIQEAILALWLERNYTKDQVLELYLNRVYFGSGAYGVEAAAQKYFGKSARAVTLGEAAILAGLVQAPSRLAPNRNPQAAQARGALVIAAMAREGLISDQMAKIALANPPSAAKSGGAGSVNYAADYVMDVLDDFIGSIDRDIVVSTTIDANLQAAGEKALVDELAAKGDKFGVSQGALVSMQPDGAIRAMVGGRNYGDSQFNRAAAAKRQPGSAFKPFVYLAALERGLTPDTIRDDAPINVKGWQPENYSRDYRGPVSLRTALALSLNTVAVRLAVEVGPKTVVQTAQRLGITSKLEPNASIALGTSEVTPVELVTGYAPFANGGIGVMPYVIRQVKTSSGELIYSRTGTGLGRVVDPQMVGMMNAMMRETLLTGTARKAELPGWEAAGKTGTSQDWRDAWFVGYTSTLLTGVWLGNDDGSPTRKASGSTLPVEVWSRFMKVALAGQPPSPLPGGQWKQLSPAPAGDPSFVPAPPGLIPDPSAGAPVAAATPPARASGGGPLILPPAPISQQASAAYPPAPQPMPAQRPPAGFDGPPRPPGMVPNGSAPGRAPPPPRSGGFLDRLFGG
ncbi:transglycosylase domain-containing protein [Alsobacter ponti]